MARLSELVEALAGTLDVEARTVSVCARYLREAGLIQQKGRGTSAARMGPKDAANLLLGIMVSGLLRDAPKYVKIAREATLDSVRGSKPYPYPFLKDDKENIGTIGDIMESLIEEAARFGDPLTSDNLPITNLFFSVSDHGEKSWFDLDTGDSQHVFLFKRDDPRLDGLKHAERVKTAKRIFGARRWGLSVVTQINIHHIHEIAKVLRGGDDGDVNAAPFAKEH